MSTIESHEYLKRRFAELFIDFPKTDYVFLLGRPIPSKLQRCEAFGFMSADDLASMMWPWSQYSPHSATFFDFADKTETHAFFGSVDSITRFSDLSRASIRTVSGFSVPAGYDGVECQAPEIVWARWLANRYANEMEHRIISWDRPNHFCWRPLEDASRLDVKKLEPSELFASHFRESIIRLSGRLPELQRPRWDETNRKLYFGDQEICKYSRNPAHNQTTILAAFEEEHWRESIDDPLPPTRGVPPKRRLADAAKNLNQKQEQIKFHLNGTGEGICWRPTH